MASGVFHFVIKADTVTNYGLILGVIAVVPIADAVTAVREPQ